MLEPSRLEILAELILRAAALEIEHTVRRSIARSIGPAETPRRARAPMALHQRTRPRRKLVPLPVAVARLERQQIKRALDENRDSVAGASRALQIPLTTLKYKLKKYRLR